jgi:thioredoxin reductase (NADPH)
VRLFDHAGCAGGLIRNAHWIENYPGLEPLNGLMFAARLEEHLARFGIDIEPRRVERVCETELEPARERVWAIETSTPDGGRESIEAGAVILAPGTRARALGVPGEAEQVGRTVFHEVRDLLAVVSRPRRAIVAGGGEAALDYALTLASAGASVLVLMRGERPRAAARLVAAVAARSTIKLRTGVSPEHIRPADHGIGLEIASVKGHDTTPATLTADALLVAVGRESRTDEIVPGLGPADGELAPTNRPGLYVIGDARLGCLGQAGIAVGDGLAAAMRAAEWLARVPGERPVRTRFP